MHINFVSMSTPGGRPVTEVLHQRAVAGGALSEAATPCLQQPSHYKELLDIIIKRCSLPQYDIV